MLQMCAGHAGCMAPPAALAAQAAPALLASRSSGRAIQDRHAVADAVAPLLAAAARVHQAPARPSAAVSKQRPPADDAEPCLPAGDLPAADSQRRAGTLTLPKICDNMLNGSVERETERERESHHIFSSHLRTDQMCRGSRCIRERDGLYIRA